MSSLRILAVTAGERYLPVTADCDGLGFRTFHDTIYAWPATNDDNTFNVSVPEFWFQFAKPKTGGVVFPEIFNWVLLGVFVPVSPVIVIVVPLSRLTFDARVTEIVLSLQG